MRYSEQTGKELIAAISEFQPSVIVFQRLEVILYLEIVRATFDGSIVLDLDEVAGPLNDSMVKQTLDKQERITRLIWSQLVAKYEAQIIPKFDHVWVSSDQERSNFVNAYATTTSVSVVPNSIDICNYTATLFNREPKTIVFTGNFGYLPNLNAVQFLIEDVLPLLPDYTLDVVGTHTPQWIRDLDNPQVNVIGEVPDVAPFIRSGSVTVAPIISGGASRIKVLEAMACGTPVLGTSFGVNGHDLTLENIVLAHRAA
jgi:glycosyltransferase involved in cell wall biosynthesis